MHANAKFSGLAARLHPGDLDGAVEDAHGLTDLIDEAASGFGQADASCVAVEENDAKVFLQRLYPSADARLTCAERERGTIEAEILSNGECLDQGDHGDAASKDRKRRSYFGFFSLSPSHVVHRQAERHASSAEA